MKSVKAAMPVQISETLRQRLAGKNLSKIARELGIRKSLLADWVSSRRIPSLKNVDSLLKIASYLGISLEELLLGEKEVERKIIISAVFEDEQRTYRVNVERLK